MARRKNFSQLVELNTANLSIHETFLLEAELFILLCEELKNYFKSRYINYFQIIKFNKEKEHQMLEASFITLMIQDILSTEEYTLEGIARYTNSDEEIVQEILLGKNVNPSANLVARLFELHRSIRKDVYQAIRDKIVKINYHQSIN